MRKIACGLFLFIAIASPLHAQLCGEWESANGLAGLNLRAVTWNDEELVAGGDTGIATSTDGYRWVTRHRDASLNIHGMASNDTTAVAVGYYAIHASDDNRTWSQVYYNAGYFFWDVTWSGTKFVAVGNGVAGYSADGHSWTVFAITGNYTSVIWDGAQFIAAGTASGGGSITTSPDGITWTPVTVGQTYYDGVASSGALAVATKAGNAGVATRSGGGAWVEQSVSGFSEFASIFWTGTRFIASAHDASSVGRAIVASTDGVNWTTLEPLPANMDVTAFTFADVLIHLPEEPGPPRRIAAISSDGALALSSGFFAWSDDDGSSWTQLYLGLHYLYGNRFIALTWTGDRFLALTENFSRNPHVSWDGVHWITPIEPTTSGYLAPVILWNGSTALAFRGDLALTSGDGIAWTEHVLGNPGEGFNDGVWDGDRFVIGGYGVRTSTDGMTWNSGPVFGSGEKHAMAWNGSRYVLAGDQLWTSTDAASWTNTVPIANVYDIAWNGTTFCAVGTNILTSPDGVTWTPAENPNAWQRIHWTGSEFIAFRGAQGIYGVSPDGIAWTTHSLPTDDFPGYTSILTAASDGDHILFVLEGLSGLTLLRTSCTTPLGPVLESITPHGGLTTGGTAVTLRGRNFPAGSVVRFGGVDAQITSYSATAITAVAPAMNAGSVEVTVGALGEEQGRLHEAFRYRLPPPEVSGVQPPQGPLAGGTLLTISGASFVDGATVQVGTAAATNVVVTSATTITATTPAGTNGAVDVIVVNPDEQASNAGVFTYADPTIAFTPATQSATPGATRTATLTVSYPQQSSTNVALSSTRTAIASVPASIEFPAGTSSVEVTLTAGLPGSATITATLPPLLGSATANTSLGVAFTDGTLSAGKVIKAAHILELRRAVNALRAEGGLGPFSFLDATLIGVKIKVAHLTELRTALNAARSAKGWSQLTFTHTLQSGVTRIREVDVSELRSGLAQ